MVIVKLLPLCFSMQRHWTGRNLERRSHDWKIHFRKLLNDSVRKDLGKILEKLRKELAELTKGNWFGMPDSIVYGWLNYQDHYKP